jgi:Na+/H+-dicarboxylate symporter
VRALRTSSIPNLITTHFIHLKKGKNMKSSLYILLAILAGIASGLTHWEVLLKTADVLSHLFMNFLELIAAPIVFLSIFSTLLSMGGFKEVQKLGRKTFSYTLLTTLLAAGVALLLFSLVNPAKYQIIIEKVTPQEQGSYLSFFTNIIPSNFFGAFIENNVIGIAFIAFLLGIAAQQLSDENKKPLTLFFSSLFKLVLKVTELVIFVMPFGIWAFMTLLVGELNSVHLSRLILYLAVVLGSNLLQGLIILPLFLKIKGISPWKVFRGSGKALLLAFFSKSSNATLPVTLKCAENELGINPKVAHFSLPLCTVINMNGCAAFILTTVLFVSEMNGVVFSPMDLFLWVILATIAAIGNAGVPMGCFFLSSAFLIAMNVPIELMGIILPFYALLDMVETALNVWSDLAVTQVIDRDLKHEKLCIETLVDDPL